MESPPQGTPPSHFTGDSMEMWAIGSFSHCLLSVPQLGHSAPTTSVISQLPLGEEAGALVPCGSAPLLTLHEHARVFLVKPTPCLRENPSVCPAGTWSRTDYFHRH